MKCAWWITLVSVLAVGLAASGVWNYLQYQAHQEILNDIANLKQTLQQLQQENIKLRAQLIQPTPEIPGVVLTFDDGPYRLYNKGNSIEHTEIILNILKANNLKATFFVLGCQFDPHQAGNGGTLERYKAWLQRMVAEGQTIGIHNDQHVQYYKESQKQLERSLSATAQKIKAITGVDPSVYVRSPGGAISPEVDAYLIQRGNKHVYWHIEGEPLHLSKPEQFLAHIKSELDRGMRGVILMHDRNASYYLPELLKYLAQKNIKVMTLSEWESKFGLPVTPHQLQSTTWK